MVKTLSEYLDQIALSEEQITSVTKYLKEIHESESQLLYGDLIDLVSASLRHFSPV